LLGTGVAATVPGKTPDAESTVTPSSGVNETSAVSLTSPLKLWFSWSVARKAGEIKTEGDVDSSD
jgi:hypothetical protein